MIKYRLKITFQQHEIIAGIRDCDSLMKNNNIQGCLIESIDKIHDPEISKTFDNIDENFEYYF